MNLEKEITGLAGRAKKASCAIYAAPAGMKKRVLLAAVALLKREKARIMAENRKDLEAAAAAGMSAAMMDRLKLDEKRIAVMARSLLEVARQPDPVGAADGGLNRPGGLKIRKVRVPIGVVLIIYESRPNVTLDSAALCVKAGNAVILRGGREALHSNRVLAALFRRALSKAGLPADCVQLVPFTDRKAVPLLTRQEGLIDLVIPRGGEALIRAVMESSRIPVLKHYKGVCHVYVDRFADVPMAQRIAVNSKAQRPAVCNAAETLLLDEGLSGRAAFSVLKALSEQGVRLRGDAASRRIFPAMEKAAERDYYNEYLELTMNVRVVDGVGGAADHIARYGSAHTDAIVTRSPSRARAFLSRVDSSSVMWNASTRLSDGAIYGLGAEIGISTDKIHARGPMGARDLTTYKWVVTGRGNLRG